MIEKCTSWISYLLCYSKGVRNAVDEDHVGSCVEEVQGLYADGYPQDEQEVGRHSGQRGWLSRHAEE